MDQKASTIVQSSEFQASATPPWLRMVKKNGHELTGKKLMISNMKWTLACGSVIEPIFELHFPSRGDCAWQKKTDMSTPGRN